MGRTNQRLYEDGGMDVFREGEAFKADLLSRLIKGSRSLASSALWNIWELQYLGHCEGLFVA